MDGEKFDLQATMALTWQALGTVVCTVGFQVAWHGLILSCLIGLLGLHMSYRGRPTGKPLLAVFKKVTIFCLILSSPGAVTLLTSGRLPPVGQLSINSLGLIGFWSLVIAHLSMEEMNFQWFTAKK